MSVILAIEKWLEAESGIEPPYKVSRLRSWINIVYQLSAKANRYIVKLYPKSWRSKVELLWEIDLIEHLTLNAAPVAAVKQWADGSSLKEFCIHEREYWAILFEYADGEKPQQPFTPELYYLEGKAIAQIHHVGDTFRSKHERFELSTYTLLEEPLNLIKQVSQNSVVVDFFSELAENTKVMIDMYTQRGLDWGPVHSDVTLDNLHFTRDKRVIFYDFERAAYGYRAIDIQGWVLFAAEYRSRVDAFLQGYQEIRNLSETDIAAAPVLNIANEFFIIKVELLTQFLNDPIQRPEDYLAEKAAHMKPYLHYLTMTAGQ